MLDPRFDPVVQRAKGERAVADAAAFLRAIDYEVGAVVVLVAKITGRPEPGRIAYEMDGWGAGDAAVLDEIDSMRLGEIMDDQERPYATELEETPDA